VSSTTLKSTEKCSLKSMINAETMISCIVESRLEARQSLAVEFKGGLKPSFFYVIIIPEEYSYGKGQVKTNSS